MVAVQWHNQPEAVRPTMLNGRPETISADVRETDDAVIVTLVLPKVDPNEITIQADDIDRVTVSWRAPHHTNGSTSAKDDIRESPSPLVEVSFASDADMWRARDLFPPERPIVGLPNRGLVVDIPLLKRFKAEGIPIYPSAIPIEERYQAPVDIDELLEELREIQRSMETGEQSSVRPE